MSQVVVYPSAARTATPAAVTLFTNRVKAVRIVFDATAITSTPDVTCKIEAVDSLSGKATLLLTTLSVATAVTTVLNVGPGVTAAANAAANSFLGDSIRITMTHANANSMTYSVSAHLIK
jgi:hypothetical protein